MHCKSDVLQPLVFRCKAAAAELSDEVTRSSDELSDELRSDNRITRVSGASESGIRARDLGLSTEQWGLAKGDQCGGSSWTGPTNCEAGLVCVKHNCAMPAQHCARHECKEAGIVTPVR